MSTLPNFKADPYDCYQEALKLGRAVSKAKEEVIARSDFWSYRYALDVLKGRFKLGEGMEPGACIAWYASDVLIPSFNKERIFL